MSGDYIFLSYSHRDSGKIQPIVDWLEEHYHVWYDKNLGVAHEYNEEIADHIRNAKIVIAFFSGPYIESPYCRDEIMYARTKGVEILGIVISPVQLSEGMQLRLGRFQMLNFTTGQIDFEKIISNSHIQKCKKESAAGLLIDHLHQTGAQLQVNQVPHLLFSTDFDSKNNFSARTEWTESKSGKLRVPIGLRQDVQTDEITEAYYDTAHGHQCIYGKTMSGKSTLLQTIVMQFIEKYSPDAIQFYMLDFGNYMLEVFKNAPHVGDTMDSSDLEKVKRFFLYMETELRDRIRFFRNGSYSLYAQKYGPSRPVILIVIDGFEVFHERYLSTEKNQEAFRALLREGNRAGILFLLTRETTRNILYGMPRENIQPLTALGYATGEKYSDALNESVGITDDARARIQRENFETPGKGMIKAGKKLYVFQSALPGDIAEDYDRYDALAAKCMQMRRAWQGKRAPGVPAIPEDFSFDLFLEMPEVAEMPVDRNRLLLGLQLYSARPVAISLTNSYIYSIAGRKSSGKSNLLRIFMKQAVMQNAGGIVVDPDGIHTSLGKEAGLVYASTAQELVRAYWALLGELKVRIAERQKRLSNTAAGPEAQLPGQSKPFYVFIDGLEAFFNLVKAAAATEPTICTGIQKIIEKGTDCGVYFFITVDSDKKGWQFSEPAPGLLKLIQANCNNGVFLGGNVFDSAWYGIDFLGNKAYQYDIELAHGKGTALLIRRNSMVEDIVKIPLYQK